MNNINRTRGYLNIDTLTLRIGKAEYVLKKGQYMFYKQYYRVFYLEMDAGTVYVHKPDSNGQVLYSGHIHNPTEFLFKTYQPEMLTLIHPRAKKRRYQIK